MREGDSVQNAFGELIKVASVKIHREALCSVVELRTREASLTVSATHRVVVPDTLGNPADLKEAAELSSGDVVFCGDRAASLVKVLPYRIVTQLIEIAFEPDCPVQSFMAPKWSVLSKGASAHYDTDDGF